MQGTRLQSSCRKRHSYQTLLFMFLFLGTLSAPGVAAGQKDQAVHGGSNVNISDRRGAKGLPEGSLKKHSPRFLNYRNFVASKVFLLQNASAVQGFRTSTAYDENALTITAVGYLDEDGNVEEFGKALLVNIKRFPVKQERVQEPVPLDQADSKLYGYKITRLTGELIGDGGIAQIYGVEIVANYEVEGVMHRVTAFDLLGVGDSRYEMDNAAMSHTDALRSPGIPLLSGAGTSAEQSFDEGIGKSSFSSPPYCSTCGDDWNAAINQCDFYANVCVASIVTSHVLAAIACPATTPILLTACIAAVDLSYSLGLASCAINLNSCFVQANRDLDNCNRTCEGSPGSLP